MQKLKYLEDPDFIQFSELLYDRINTLFSHFEDLETKYMLILNLLDKGEENLIYVGTRKQRALLELDDPKYCNLPKGQWKVQRDKNWKILQNIKIGPKMEGVETFQFFDLFRKGALKIEDVKPNALKEYFAEKNVNLLRENEFPIIKDYFKIDEDLYTGIPLLGKGLFLGIVWIVFNKSEKRQFNKSRNIKNLVKLFQIAYDEVEAGWSVGENEKSLSYSSEAQTYLQEKNPIQEDCGIASYYEKSQNYYEHRFQQNNKIFRQIFDQYFKTAVISILLDSFSHNISAHSLTTLTWWFRELKAFEDDGVKVDISNPLVNYVTKSNNKYLSNELLSLFKFIAEKGGFWSGITRESNYVGETANLFQIIWGDFLNNPLYLGTIASTEGVQRLNVKIEIIQEEDQDKQYVFGIQKKIKKTSTGVWLSGIFASINLKGFHHHKDNKDSVFVKKGELFDAFKLELEKLQVFLPGGIVGKHAFYTLMENEIRNVKHYSGSILREIQKNGLTLTISIYDLSRKKKKRVKEINNMVKIGIHIDHITQISEKILERRIDSLAGDLITSSNFKPRLGGTYQDKICASMLLNSTFEKVQDRNSDFGKLFYPWISTGISLVKNNQLANSGVVNEQQLLHNTYDLPENGLSAFTGDGLLKKYFYIWKGSDICMIEPGVVLNLNALPNISRYKFIHLREGKYADLNCFNARQHGVIRIIKSPNNFIDLTAAYIYWLGLWFKELERKNLAINFVEGDTITGRIIYEGSKKISFLNKETVEDVDLDSNHYQNYISNYEILDLRIAHGHNAEINATSFNYRSHGILVKHFFNGRQIERTKDGEPAKMAELLEVIYTKICLFDRRIFNRVKGKNRLESIERLDFYRNNLFLAFKNENKKAFKELQHDFRFKYNFLILHLSFIESLVDSEGERYTEERVIDFIDDQILMGAAVEDVPDNFILVITTGRGRMIWWDLVKSRPEYAKFVTFRSIESILNGIEDALTIGDDFDLKYYLVKLLFGS